MSSAGVWTNFTEYLKSWLVFRPRNCLCRLYQNLKPKNLAFFFFFQVMSTPQMFTMLHVSIKYFSYAISDQTCSGPLISYMCIYFFSLVYVFHLLKCIFRKLWLDLTWLYRLYEWVTGNRYTSAEHDTQTRTLQKQLREMATI